MNTLGCRFHGNGNINCVASVITVAPNAETRRGLLPGVSNILSKLASANERNAASSAAITALSVTSFSGGRPDSAEAKVSFGLTVTQPPGSGREFVASSRPMYMLPEN